ncbi:hypothetical protein BDF22DRAFT_652328 [Syncephalis plumigaleata]|nr:hypothetical protein BDF22DRAFT_652328 [Syncephalis plumigaleata]
MGKGTSSKNNGLGKAIIRARFNGRQRDPNNTSSRHTTEVDDGPNWVKMQSITQENDLDEFLRTAQLAGTEFTAERLNVKVVSNAYNNPFLLNKQQEKETLAKHEEHRRSLTVPRRPHWDKTTTAEELQQAERESFVEWRRGLALLEEEHGLVLTPFEKNLEVWRQLWRVIERSDLIVQIVDARNPLFFRSTDLETYVQEIDPRKRCLLLVNKADMLTANQRRLWAEYFQSNGIEYIYFSALKAGTARADPEDEEDKEEEEEEREEEEEETANKLNEITLDDNATSEEEEKESKSTPVKPWEIKEVEEEEEESIRVLSAEELADRLLAECPSMEGQVDAAGQQLGYPNVGKSSTINALVGAKCVAVGSTPGKTKHFQTIHLTDQLLLCDCPGLVFPSFATTKAAMVCDGVLPIDQLREYTGPMGLVARRIPKWFIEATYGIRVIMRSEEEGGTGIPTAEEVLVAYATARGFMKSGMGNPDESRAARCILKDYVNGKLLFCHPPPNQDAGKFNEEIHNPALFEQKFERKKLVGEARQLKQVTRKMMDTNQQHVKPGGSSRVNALDNAFFNGQHSAPRVVGKYASNGFNRVQMFPHQTRTNNDGTISSSANHPSMMNSSSSSSSGAPLLVQDTGKKHKKGKKHVKHRHRAGYDI